MSYKKNNLFLSYLFILTLLVFNLPFQTCNSSFALTIQSNTNKILTNLENKSDLNFSINDTTLFNRLEFGLNNKISNFRQILNFDSFESTNRQNIGFNNYNSIILLPEIYAKYNLNNYFALSLGLSYLNFDYEDNLLESFPISQNGEPIIAKINTQTLAKISNISLNQNLFFKYKDFTINAGLSVFFCLHLT